jgi:hypothetical protein
MSREELLCLVAIDPSGSRQPVFERIGNDGDPVVRGTELYARLTADGWSRRTIVHLLRANDEGTLLGHIDRLSVPRFECVIALDPEGLLEPTVERVGSLLEASERAGELRERFKAQGRNDMTVTWTSVETEAELDACVAGLAEHLRTRYQARP